MVQNNKAVIITSSSTYESRVNAIEEFLFFKGYDVLVLEPGYDHHTKQERYSRKNNHEYLPMIAYKKNLSLRRIYSVSYTHLDVYKRQTLTPHSLILMEAISQKQPGPMVLSLLPLYH